MSAAGAADGVALGEFHRGVAFHAAVGDGGADVAVVAAGGGEGVLGGGGGLGHFSGLFASGGVLALREESDFV